jgi:cysteine desulfurase/selenocysteine lyase
VLDVDAYERLLPPRTRLVALAHVSNVLGTVNPVRELVDMAHVQDVPVLLDGAQATPHLPVDVMEIGCDFYAFSGHKIYGPSGIGALWARRELLEEMPPWQGGGSMIESVTFEKTTFAGIPAKFEAGTPNIAGAVALAAAIEYVEAIGLERIAAHEHELLRYAEARLGELPAVRTIGTAPGKAAVVSFAIDGVHPHDVATVLDREGVAVRAGHHCAQPLMERFGVPATVRASLGLYNTRADVDALIDGIRAVLEVFA